MRLMAMTANVGMGLNFMTSYVVRGGIIDPMPVADQMLPVK